MITRQEQIKGGLVGLLIGDALGVPYEFHAPEQLPPSEQIEMAPPPGFARAHVGTPPGTWSDDGAQALALLASLLACGRLDLDDLARRLVAWYEQGAFAVDGRVFDVGNQTREALHALQRGVPTAEAGPRHEWANGNGSLMRVLPLALWHQGSDAALVRDARRQSLLTHGHLRSQLCGALYCLWARRLVQGVAEAWGAAVATLRDLYGAGTPEREELERHVRPDQPAGGTGTGYVVDTLHSARGALAQGEDYATVVRAAIALGHDTDTTACVAGGLAGLRWGIEGIPRRWRRALRGQALVTPLAHGLLRHATG